MGRPHDVWCVARKCVDSWAYSPDSGLQRRDPGSDDVGRIHAEPLDRSAGKTKVHAGHYIALLTERLRSVRYLKLCFAFTSVAKGPDSTLRSGRSCDSPNEAYHNPSGRLLSSTV